MRAGELLNFITTQSRPAGDGSGKTEYRGIFQRGTETPLILTDWYPDQRQAKAEAGAELTQGILDGRYRGLYKYDAFQELRSFTENPTVNQEAEHISEVLNEQHRESDLQDLSALVDEINANQEKKEEPEPPVIENRTETHEKQKRKAGWIPAVLLGGALVSLPFWAVPWKVSYTLPEGAVLQESMPETVRFYEKAELPDLAMEGQEFLGWYTDSEMTKPISTLQFTIGNKTLYAGFKDKTETEIIAKDDENTEEETPAAAIPSASADTVTVNDTPEETVNADKEQTDIKDEDISVVNTAVQNN